MEGTNNNNNCAPSDLWMSHLDAQFSGNLGNPSVGDRTMSSPTHLDLSRKQTTLYNNYDIPNAHYKQNVQAMTSVGQPFATSSNRSAWEFASEKFSSIPKEFTSQSLSQPISNATRFSQSDFTTQSVSQSSRTFTPHSMSESLRDFPPGSVSQAASDFLPQSISQPVRDMTAPSMAQSGGGADRSVWAHLYSLDPSLAPSLASYNMSSHSHVSQNASYTQEKPYAYTRPQLQVTGASDSHQPSSIRSSVPPQKPPLILGKVNAGEQIASPYINRSSMPSDVMSGFAPSLYSNVSDTPSTTKQSQSVDYEEQLGGYSPVSPPTHDSSSSFSAPTSGQDVELKNHGFMSSNRLSRFSSDSNPTLPIHQGMHSDASYSDSSLLPLPLDVPLDMTKAWSSQDTNTISTTTVTSNVDTQVNQSVVKSIQPSISSQDASNQVVATNLSSDAPSVNQFANFSQKVPKKSNFYGRDASYFSVPETSPQPSHACGGDITSNDALSSNRSGVDIDSVSMQIHPNLDVPQSVPISQVQITPVSTLEPTTSSNSDSTNTTFADSFIEASAPQSTPSTDSIVCATEETLNSENSKKENTSSDIYGESTDSEGENVLLSQVKAVLKQKQGDVAPKESSEIIDQKEQTGECDMTPAEIEPVENMEQELSTKFVAPITLTNLRGRATRGRKRKGAGVQRRQGKKAAAKTLGLMAVQNESEMASVIGEPVEGAASNGLETGDVGMEIVNTVSMPIPTARATRGRKRKGKAAAAKNPDSEESMPRRSSNRRSKDNAMRLIELQAENSHLAKPAVQEPQQPARPRRRAAKAAVEGTFDESKQEEDVLEEKNSSSDELSDGKDVDYAVGADDVEDLVKDELLDVKVDKKKTVEKRSGGLKISIKLGLDSSAEIVSGIDESPPRKRRKVVKKKVEKTKFKSKAIIQDEDGDDDDVKDNDEKMTEPESVLSQSISDKKILEKDIKTEPEGKVNIVEKHSSLMDKYFSSANSATLARQVQKPGPTKKGNKLKHDTSAKSKSSKNVKGSASKANSTAVPSIHSSNDSDKPASVDNNSNSDTGLPKFVCGYCPKRYHSKQALLSHMEDHMAEMEDKADKTSGGNVSKEPKKPATAPKKTESGPVKQSMPKLGKKNEESEEAKFNCGECGKNFTSKLNLLDHVRTHTAEKPFECNLCHKCFKERDQLSAHRKVHAQEGLIRCSVCSKGFVKNADLAAHMESHPKRSKPSQLQAKSPVVSDPLKKSVKVQLSRDKDAVTSKPKSFASALEPNFEKNKEPTTILLKRNDALSKDEPLKSVKVTKPVASLSKSSKEEQRKKLSPVVKIQDIKKDLKEAKFVDQKPKVDSEKTLTVEKSKEVKGSSDSGECTCQECPECVTRFLQNFE